MLERDCKPMNNQKTCHTIDPELNKAFLTAPDVNNNDLNNNYKYQTNERIERQSIKGFFHDQCILVTGGTGFLGKVLLEKLLRSCDSLRCIYVLLRSKRGLNSDERYTELIQNPVRVGIFLFQGEYIAIRDKILKLFRSF